MKRLIPLLLLLLAVPALARPFPRATLGPPSDIGMPLERTEGEVWWRSESRGDVCIQGSPTIKLHKLEIGRMYRIWEREGMMIDFDRIRGRTVGAIKGENPCSAPATSSQTIEISGENLEALAELLDEEELVSSSESVASDAAGGILQFLLQLVCRLPEVTR